VSKLTLMMPGVIAWSRSSPAEHRHDQVKGVGMEREQSTPSSLSVGDKASDKTPERRDPQVASNIEAYLKEHEDHRASRVMQIHDSLTHAVGSPRRRGPLSRVARRRAPKGRGDRL